MLDNYKQDYTRQRQQFVLVDQQGMVLECSGTLLPIEKGQILKELHPFFESLEALQTMPDPKFSFYCVHLEIGTQDLIADIDMVREKEGMLLVIHDLTEHYNSYQAVAQARNESIIHEELIVLKNTELEERERFKNLFIQNFSHELRNPLMSSMAITQILSDTSLSSEQKQLLEVLRDSNMHLKLLLEDTLSISMIASGKLVIRNTLFNIHKMLDLLSFTYKTKAKAKGLQFTYTAGKQVPEYVEGDRLRLFQVLTNLLDNALKYTVKGGVELMVGFNQQWANKVHLHFEVTDSGPGIPKDKQPTIFETFSQLASPEKQQGTGLGLALVKGLLELMESTITLHSVPGKGSTFSFDLGLKVPLQSTMQQQLDIGSAATSRKMGSPGRKYKLLLVEDDERVLTVLFKILMDSDQFYIDVLTDGGEVLETVIQNEYDLILMDINLPNTRGDHITRIIRDFPFKNVKQLPIIGMTAYAYEDHMQAYKEAGMNTVLAKPFDKEELLQTIFGLLRT